MPYLFTKKNLKLHQFLILFPHVDYHTLTTVCLLSLTFSPDWLPAPIRHCIFGRLSCLISRSDAFDVSELAYDMRSKILFLCTVSYCLLLSDCHSLTPSHALSWLAACSGLSLYCRSSFVPDVEKWFVWYIRSGIWRLYTCKITGSSDPIPLTKCNTKNKGIFKNPFSFW